MAGMSKGSGTRSGLLWEVERILREIVDANGELPQILFMENVKQIIGKKNLPDFEKWKEFLDSIGYYSTYKVLNAKEYGVAQNRERCFMFSFLKSEFGENPKYEFPKTIPLNVRLKDYLEDEVPENMYIKTEKAEKLLKQLVDNGTILRTIAQSRAEQSRAEQSRAELLLMEQSICQEKNKLQTASRLDTMQELSIHDQKEQWSQNVQELGFIDKGTGKHQSNMVYSDLGISRCLVAVDHKEPLKVMEIDKWKNS